jgi:Leucine-rich repeat (LRR) protein
MLRLSDDNMTLIQSFLAPIDEKRILETSASLYSTINQTPVLCEPAIRTSPCGRLEWTHHLLPIVRAKPEFADVTENVLRASMQAYQTCTLYMRPGDPCVLNMISATNLRTLRFDGDYALTSSDATLLGSMHALRELSIREPSLRNTACEFLGSLTLPGLKNLSLDGVLVAETDDTIKALCRCLQRMPTLSALSMRNVCIGPLDGKISWLIDALPNTLQTLDLGGNWELSMRVAELSEIRHRLHNLIALKIDACRLTLSRLNLRGLSLQTLDVSQNTVVSWETLNSIGDDLPSLQRLELRKCNLTRIASGLGECKFFCFKRHPVQALRMHPISCLDVSGNAMSLCEVKTMVSNMTVDRVMTDPHHIIEGNTIERLCLPNIELVANNVTDVVQTFGW